MKSIRTAITNNFVFNNPEFDYKNTDINSKSIIFIKKDEGIDNRIENYIPCLFIQEREQSSKFLIFFHGNSEDIFLSELIGQLFAEKLQMNVIIVEYPGYSIYDAPKSAEIMCYDSLKVYSFIKKYFNLEDDDIFVLGRSIGTGPAVYLASEKKPKGLILISPFKSIKSIKGGFLGFFLLDIFKSIDIISKVSSPILFIHGKNDHLIDYTHSEELLSEKLKKISDFSELRKNAIFINDNMTHNEMDLEKDVFDKIIEFISKNKSFKPQKGYFNFMDKKFKKLFDIPLAVQKYLFKLNISLDNPNLIKMESRFSILLHDERIAFAKNNFQIEIYDTEEMEKDLIIKTDEIGLINSLYQLNNSILVACSDYFVVFYSLKKYKYEQIKLIQFQKSIIKVDQINNNQILILTKESLIVLNNKYEKIQSYKTNFQYIKVISPYIAIQTLSQIIIFKYENDKLDKIKEVNLKAGENISYNLINIEKKYFSFLDNNDLNFVSLDTYKLLFNNGIFVKNPKFIFTIYNNMILIGNENGDIQILELKNQILKTILFKEAKLKIDNKIKSIIALKDGKLIISEAEKEKYEIKNEGTEDYIIENCLII
jgi:esterase/lipase